MEELVDDQCINMEDLGPPPAPMPDEHRCLKLKSFDKEIRIFSARKDYISEMLEIEKSIPSPTPETTQKLEAEQRTLEDKIKDLEGKMTEFLPCPIALCPHNYKFKAVKRPADPVIRPAKFTAKAAKNNKTASDFVFPKKTIKNVPTQKKDKVVTNNTYAALNTAQADAEDVSPPQYKIKPIFMKIIDSYNLILQELHRSHPTATNTFTKGYIKIEAQTADDHRDITTYLTGKNLQYYVIEPPSNKPLKLVIKGLPADIDPEDIKNDLISKGIKIEKIAQLKKFTTKTPLPIYMIEVTRHMASSTECPLFPKPRKGKSKSQIENLKRHNDISMVKPGLSYSQALNPNKRHQMAPRGNASSAPENKKINNNEPINLEALDANPNNTSDFSFLQAIIEMKKIFSLFPTLLSEMQKSFNCTNPADKLNCLLKGVCSSLNNLTVNDA
ncbi:uncharacterized protein TNIN_221811 [Trichonephila inaurata madagascariensis]|uniref:Pre-C2HC domain-containing protein n=1 Tax=Trichonephila inaurata madagascariensis TaxID=2747483 RepID=A0A8X6YI33_9ARAC|nr:uncharacterized protein TNIN_221811 [Trichonephila inaurata madagascariensis]